VATISSSESLVQSLLLCCDSIAWLVRALKYPVKELQQLGRWKRATHKEARGSSDYGLGACRQVMGGSGWRVVTILTTL
jgi:hypothetical protein